MEDWEKWDLKYTIAEFIVPRLIAYKAEVENNNITSIPLWIESDNLPFILEQDKQYSTEEIHLINKEWAKILDKILFPFQSLLSLDDINFEDVQKKQEEGIYLFSKYYFNLWD